MLVLFPLFLNSNISFTQTTIVTISDFYTTSPSYSMDFSSDNVGYIACKNYIYKTTNGGLNWSANLVPELSNGVYQIKFYNDLVGYMSASGSKVYKTSNGGINWINVTPGPTSYYTNLLFFSENEFIMQSADSLYRTTNGASNWLKYGLNLPATYYMVRPAKDGNNLYGICYSNTYSSSSLFKSTNHGQSWVSTNFPGYSGYLFQCISAVNSHIVIGGQKFSPNPKILLRSGNETGFQFINDIPEAGDCRGIELYNNGYGYSLVTISGNPYSSILKTTNFGQNWTGDSSFIQNFRLIDLTNSKLFALDYFSGSILIKSQSVGITNLNLEIPKNFELFQNYPNPFNPNTKIKFQIHMKDLVQLKVFDSKGNEIQNLLNETIEPGTYNFDFNGGNLSSGVYYYKIMTTSYTNTKKMVLLK